MASGHIIIGGTEYPCAAEVETWHSHGLEFRPRKGGRKRVLVPDLFVLHVTGGENPPRTVYDVLLNRKNANGKPTPLGVEFMIDVGGGIWQHCDPLVVDTFDAAGINDRSIGVEIVNYGYAATPAKVPSRGKSRPLYDTIVHGKAIKMARSNPAQIKALVALADALTTCPALKIPKRLPRDGKGRLHANLMSSAEVAIYRGVIGHMHVSGAKIDPGTDCFDALDAAGYK